MIDGPEAVVTSNILWDNRQVHHGQLALEGSARGEITHNNIQGKGHDAATSSIDADPLFCDPGNGDYSLAANSPSVGSGIGGSDMGTEAVTCGDKFVVRNVKARVNYGATGTDTLLVTAEVANPQNHTLAAFARYHPIGEAVADSLPLFDDGAHGDGGDGDGIYGGSVMVVDEERIFRLQARVYNSDLGTVHDSYDTTLQATTGPVEFLAYTLPYSTTEPVPGDDIYIILSLVNRGTDAVATNMELALELVDDTMLTILSADSVIPFGDIAAGDTATANVFYSLRIDSQFPPDTDIRIALEIASEGVHFWTDTAAIHIYSPLDVAGGGPAMPGEYALRQNYPNPFNPGTTLRFDLPVDGPVMVMVHDLLGREVARLLDSSLPAGNHRLVWLGRDQQGAALPSGIYIARLQAREFNGAIRMLMIK